ncbi:acyltransferase [Spirosoma soli]|uniref:Acyltransferase n=1 Tax=Spirosoma soli TaxID=1770529 RepID=A0ABW5M511_9BACT
MNKLLKYSYLVPRKLFRVIFSKVSYAMTYYKFKVFDVKFSNFKTTGIPIVDTYGGGEIVIGRNFKMNNGMSSTLIGRQQQCFLIANSGSILIGDNVGLSGTAIHCNKLIKIGNNVRIGGNTVIYDTDFHSLNYKNRILEIEIFQDVNKQSVYIGNNVFIGAHCTILKGVTIGDNSVIGACSVVTKAVPANEIWGGNPAKFIKFNK